jgi:hypothetical protein
LRRSSLTRRRIAKAAVFCLGFVSLITRLHASDVYQYSLLEGDRRVYLWVPPACRNVRGLVVAFKNLTEQRWLEDPIVRGAASEECLGVVWIGAGKRSGLSSDMGPGAGDAFLTMQRDLAKVSGFPEIAKAPIIPTGHSAQGQFAWKFAEWAPERTIAAIPIKTVPLPADLDLHVVPLLYIVGQTTEWPQYRDGRIGDRDFFWPNVRRSALALRTAHSDALIAVAVDPGGGHFDWSDSLARLLALYIHKACASRLPTPSAVEPGPTPLRALSYQSGWLLDAAGMDLDRFKPAPVTSFTGKPDEAYWVFDRETADAIKRIQGDRVARKKQMLSFDQGGHVLPVAVEGFAALAFEPDSDGITFHLDPAYLDSVPSQLVNGGEPLGHADEPIHLSVLTGPILQISPYSFDFALSRESGADGWIEEDADQTAEYRKAVQPGKITLKGISTGLPQHIHFDKIAPQKATSPPIVLHASSDAGLPVRFYVVSGPARIEGDRLTITEFPRSGTQEIPIIVTAYQTGRAANDNQSAVQQADPVTQQFLSSR